MCCTRLAGNTGRKNAAKNRHLRIIAQLRRAVSSQLRHVATIGKNVHMSPQYGKLQPINGWDLLASLGRPSKFQPVLRHAFVTAATSLNGGQPNFARCLAVSWAGTLHTFSGALAPDRILPRTIFTLRPSLAFFYIGSVTAQHSSSGRQPNFAVWYKECNYETFAEGATYIQKGGHHVGHSCYKCYML